MIPAPPEIADTGGVSRAMQPIRVGELFKVGVGPSSSHTSGPMTAARRFAASLDGTAVDRITTTLFGSLAHTGAGHGTPDAVRLGFSGITPDVADPGTTAQMLASFLAEGSIVLPSGSRIRHGHADIRFDTSTAVARHPNALRFVATDLAGAVVADEMWFSVGGGFVERLGETAVGIGYGAPHPFSTGTELLSICVTKGLTIAEVVAQNEILAGATTESLGQDIAHLVDVMMTCIDIGLITSGLLPGALGVQRRARDLYETLEHGPFRFDDELVRIATYAMAVNEQNAAGQRVVTAPTNGAAGVIPAVLRHLHDHQTGDFDTAARIFMLTATAIGSIIKHNASISGAEVGCQGEVGSASAMAAAGMCAVLGGTPEQIEHAAEIALEHHLGMTCDPVGGLVQIPCIERNGFGATKAVLAAHMALRGWGEHLVTFDQVVETMRQTGLDMHANYRETSRGGLAVNVPNC